jgi:hypothetical protein
MKMGSWEKEEGLDCGPNTKDRVLPASVRDRVLDVVL